MVDRVTSIEVNTELAKVFEIAEHWATGSKYSIYEKTDNRVLYLYNGHISVTAWVSIESLGSKVRLSAWVAPKSLKPDEQGSFWKGSKIAIPIGLSLGPLGRAKKNFNKLSELIKDESNDDSLVDQPASTPAQQVLSKDNLAKTFIWLGVFVLLYGALNIYNGTSSMARQLFPSTAEQFVLDGMINILLGFVFLTCSRLLKKGKAMSIWLYGVTLLITVGHEILKGANFPFIPILIGVWIGSQLLGLKKQGQLT